MERPQGNAEPQDGTPLEATVEPDLLVIDVSGVDGRDARNGASLAGSAAPRATTDETARVPPNRNRVKMRGTLRFCCPPAVDHRDGWKWKDRRSFPDGDSKRSANRCPTVTVVPFG